MKIFDIYTHIFYYKDENNIRRKDKLFIINRTP